MVQIRVLQGIAGDPNWAPGEIVELPANEAAKWADGERAEYVSDAPPAGDPTDDQGDAERLQNAGDSTGSDESAGDGIEADTESEGDDAGDGTESEAETDEAGDDLEDDVETTTEQPPATEQPARETTVQRPAETTTAPRPSKRQGGRAGDR
jgi:hypothetical protein